MPSFMPPKTEPIKLFLNESIHILFLNATKGKQDIGEITQNERLYGFGCHLGSLTTKNTHKDS